LYTKEELRKIE
jgi:hypothetical protein